MNLPTPPVPPRPDLGSGDGRDGPPAATWKAIEALPVGLIALGVTAIVGAILAAVFPSQFSGSASDLRESPGFFAFANMAQEVILLATVLWWVRFVNHGPLAALGLPPRHPVADVAVGLLAGVAMVFGAGLALELTHVVVDAIAGHQVSNPEQVPETVKGVYLALSGLVVVVLAPLAEETFFRGFLYKGLRRQFSMWPAAFISAFFFGLVHFAGIKFLLIIPSLIGVGVVLALVYERRQSLLASVATHATFNLIGFLFIVFSR